MTESVDYNYVPQRQAGVHDQLNNWARWCRTGGGGSTVLPMFKGYRDNYFELPGAAQSPIDVPGAVEVQKTMAHLPEKHRMAVQWCYVYRNNPVRVCRALAVSKQGLLDLVNDGRDMVKNRLRMEVAA